MTPYEVPETVIRRFTENGCEVTAIVADPADAQQTLYGTVTRDGALVGIYYCADRVRQSELAHRHRPRPSPHPRRPTRQPVSEGAAVIVLTSILTARDSYEVEQRLRDTTRPPQR